MNSDDKQLDKSTANGGAETPQEGDDQEWQSLMGDDLVLKTLQAAPDDALEIALDDVVQLRIVGRWAPTRDDSVDARQPVFQESSCLWMQLGARDVLPAVEMAVRFMLVGETAVVWSHSKYAYGLAGRRHSTTTTNDDTQEDAKNKYYELPPESNVAYTITVLGKVDTANSPETVLQFTQARKEQANDQYQHEWSKGAGKTRIVQAYTKIAKDMEAFLQQYAQEETNSPETSHLFNTAHNLRIDALNNVTAASLRAGEYHAAKTAAVAVLELEPNNYKALLRAAKAALMDPSSEFVEVQKALEAAQQESGANSNNDELAKLTQEFARRKQSYDQASKRMYQKAFRDAKSKGSEKVKDHKSTAVTESQKDDATTTTNDESSPPPVNSRDETRANIAKNETTVWPDWVTKYVLSYGMQILGALAVWVFLEYKRRNEQDTAQPEF